MPNRPLIKCRKVGCNTLLSKSGYCSKHERTPWKLLDNKKTAESCDFYHSTQWGKVSKRHREEEPLCRLCKEQGLIVPAALVHHEPEREVLIARGDSPYDDKYLVSLCLACHNRIHFNRNRPHTTPQNAIQAP